MCVFLKGAVLKSFNNSVIESIIHTPATAWASNYVFAKDMFNYEQIIIYKTENYLPRITLFGKIHSSYDIF